MRFNLEDKGVRSRESDLVYRAFTAARESKTAAGSEQIKLVADRALVSRLEAFQDAGHVLMISTSRGPEQKEMTLTQLRKVGLDRVFPAPQVACTGKDETKSQFMPRTALELGDATVVFAADSTRNPEAFNGEEYRQNVETLKAGLDPQQLEALGQLEFRLAHLDLADPALKKKLYPAIAAELPALLKQHKLADPRFVVDLLR